MMIKLKLKFILLFAPVFFWMGCESIIEKPKESEEQSSVYLSISARVAHTGGEESFNTDTEDFEDRVHSLAMLVFDFGSGQKVGEYYMASIPATQTSYNFTVALAPGKRDFYFVANMPGMQATLGAIVDRTAMDAYMRALRNLNSAHYLAAESSNAFPMMRVYTNQTVTAGGSIYSPVPFKPVVQGGTENYVKLMRVVAKLDVRFDASDVNDVQKVELVNANKQFGLMTIDEEPSQYADNVEMRRVAGKNIWLAYMPEAFVATGKWWGNMGNAANKPINYFRITDKDGLTYEIPIITNEGAIPGGEYLKFAKGGIAQKPNYTIYRNHHYKYEIKNLPNRIEIKYAVRSWDVVEKTTYLGYGYNVEIDDDGKLVITNTTQNCNPHVVHLEAKNGAYFGADPMNTSVQFTELADGASQTYQVNKEGVASGKTYLEVYYNKTPGAGIVPDKEFKK